MRFIKGYIDIKADLNVSRAQITISPDGVHEDIESFTEGVSTSSEFKLNYAAKNADILAAAQDSP